MNVFYPADEPLPEMVSTDTAEFATVLQFDYKRPPVMANDRFSHWAVKARLVRDIRTATKLLAHRLPELGRIRVSLVWIVTDKRRRDGGENVTPTLKPMIDGLVDAGVVTDDTPDLVERVMPTIRYEQGGVARMELRIEKLK